VRPATRKNICGICHEPVSEKLHEDVRSGPRHSPGSGMMAATGDCGWRTASIGASTEMIDKLMMDIDSLKQAVDLKRNNLAR
jgi:hypothetical protein